MQLIVGIGIPVTLEFESVTLGWAIKAEYWLPENATNFINIWKEPFRPTIKPLSGTYPEGWGNIRRRSVPNNDANSTAKNDTTTGYDSVRKEKYEMYNEEAVVVNGTDIDMDEETLIEDNVYDADTIKSPSNFGASRWTLYKGLEALVNRYINI